MKNLITALCAAIIIATTFTATAAEKTKRQLATCDYSLSIDCEGCVKKVMNTIPYQKGVKSVDVDLKTKSAKIAYDPAKCTNEVIVEAFKKIDIKATAMNKKGAACKDSCCPR